MVYIWETACRQIRSQEFGREELSIHNAKQTLINLEIKINEKKTSHG